MSARKLDQFYTKNTVASLCIKEYEKVLADKKVLNFSWLEPSAGTGAFYNQLNGSKIGLDLEPKALGIIKMDFFEYKNTQNNVCTIGNPPFGKNATLAVSFFNHAATFSEYIGFIVPKTFLKDSLQKKLNKNFFLIHSSDMPKDSFIFDGKDYDVPTVFQIYEKRDQTRIIVAKKLTHVDFEFVDKDSANFAIQRVGVNAGRVKTDFEDNAKASHYFIKAPAKVRKIFEKIDYKSVKYNTAGNPSISKGELIELYEALKVSNNSV